MARRHLALLALAGLGLAAAVPSAVAGPASDQATIDSRIAALDDEIDEALRREEVLTTDIAAASERLDVVATEVESLGARVGALQAELAHHRERLEELRALHDLQTRRLRLLVRNERLAQDRLQERVVELYVNDPPDELEILFLVRSLNDLVSQLEYLEQIANRDREIADQVADARARTAEERKRTAATKREEEETTALLAAQTAEAEAAYADLVARRDQLASARTDRQALLTNVREQRRAAEEDLAALESAGAELEERLRASAVQTPVPAAPPSTPSASGFIWPVNGPITSGFGTRWGRLHAGVDIGVGFGTPIRAAAAGTVSHSGWLGGYGNLVVVDHGGGLSTAYAHQQRIYVSVGTQVAQGQVLGEVGSTGNSTGPHLHFEVRVNGSATDPLGYL